MAVYKVTLATKDGERKVKYIYPKTSADIVEYSNNKSVYAKIEELEYLINSIPKFKIRVVSELPTLDISGTTVYLVKAQMEDTKNIFSEYIYVNNEWELLGVQTIDLSIYYTIDQINEIVESLMEGINSKADINHIHSNVTPNPNGTAGFMSPEDKSKLDDIANGAQVNTIESIKINNNTIVPNASDKSVNITINKSTVGLNNVANINQSGAIKDITRDGITFTATKLDGTTFTFTQQDNNTTYSAGNGLSLEGTEFKLDHPISGVTQGTYGSAIKVPQIVVDDKGHITSAVNKNIPVMTKATSSAAGTAGFVPAPASGKQNSFLRGDATWSLPTKSDVGLGNVDNTKDADKPISTATQTALNNKSDINHNHNSEYANIDHTHTKDEITDLTEATTTKSGLMSSADKSKLDNIGSSGATNTSITRHLSQGTKIATITIDGTNTDLYCEKNTDTNKYHKTGSWSGLKYTATAVNSAEELSFTIPTGTSSTTVAVGNHNHNSEYANIDHTHTKSEITDLTEATTTKSGLMSSADKSKLDNIASGAVANVQSDWNQSDTTADDFIKNKPSNLVQDANYVHTDNNFTNADKNKLDNIGSSGATNTSITRHLSQGTKIATITIDGTNTDLYCEKNTDTNKYHKTGSWSGLKYTATAVNSAEELSFTIPTGTSSTTVAVGNHNHDSAYAAKSHTHTKSEITDLTEATTTKSGLMSSADKSKLDNIGSSGVTNVQSDWNQSDTTADDFIKNKPTNASASAAGLMSAADFKKINAQGIATNSDLNDIKGEGWYFCSKNTTAVTLSHCPTTMAFYMEVHKHTGVYQHIVEHRVTGAKHYHRNYYDNKWGDWVEWKLTDTTYSAATTTTSGLMSAADKSKLNGIQDQATKVAFTASLTSGTKIATITIDGTNTDLYCEKNTDTNKYHKTGSWSGLKYTAQAVNNAEELSFTIPTGTSSTTVAVGNHNHNSEYANIDHTHTKSEITDLTEATTTKSGLMSTTDKSKLNGIATNAQVNVIETIKVNNTALTPSNKAVNITVPTKVSSLTNDSKYQTDTQVATAIEELAERTPTLVDTTSDISTLDLYIGQVIMTKGYSSVGDGGGSIYLVSDTEPDVPWFRSINSLYVGIVKKEEYSAAELGMFPNNANNTGIFDSLKKGCKCTIRFGAGTYLWNRLLITCNNHYYSFVGTTDKSPYPSGEWLTNHKKYMGSATYFAPFQNNQPYIMKIGGAADCRALYTSGQANYNASTNNFDDYYFTGFVIKDIAFCDSGKTITTAMLRIEYSSNISGNLQFRNSTQECLKMRNCWEMYFDYIIMRACIRPTPTQALWTMDNYTQASANISALTVNLLDVENFKSTILRISEKANFCASTINMMQIEGSLTKTGIGNQKTIDGTTYNVSTGHFVALGQSASQLSAINPTTNLSVYRSGIAKYELATKIPLISYDKVNGVIINSISLQNTGFQWWMWGNESTTYVHSLLRGGGGFTIGVVAMDTVFHYFTINDSTENGWCRFTDIGIIKCDRTQLIPAPVSGMVFDYRFINNGSTNVFKSTIPVYQGSYHDNPYLKSLVEQCQSPTPQSGSYEIAVSPTASATAAKSVTMSSFTLENGAKAIVRFAYPDTASTSPTLNVNGTGAKAIYYNGTAIPTNYLKNDVTYHFVYDGSKYLISGTGTRAVVTIEGRSEVVIVPRTVGSCEKVSAIFSKTNATLYVRRYLNSALISESASVQTYFPETTSYTVRVLELFTRNQETQELVRRNYDSYEIVYVPNLNDNEISIINNSSLSESKKNEQLAALGIAHNLALTYLKIE